MKTIKQEVHFDASPQEVYEAYVDSKKHGQIIGSDVVFEKKVGGKFRAWGGELSGENVDLVEGKKIVQKWRADDWPEGHFSTLTLEFLSSSPPLHPELEDPQPEGRGPHGTVYSGSRKKILRSAQNDKVGTRLLLTQENVPDDKADNIDDGWHEYYWEPMREYFSGGRIK